MMNRSMEERLMTVNGFIKGRGLLTVAVSVLVIVGIFGAGSAQATLSPYPSTGYPQASGGSVYAMVQSGNTVYVGGSFKGFGGQARNRLAAFDLVTKEVLPWNPDVTYQWATVYALAVSGEDVIVGGYFYGANSIGGYQRDYIAKVSASGIGSVDGSWDPDASSSVKTLAASGTDVYVGGDFTWFNAGATSRNRIAAINVSTGTVTGWDPNASGTVEVIKLSGEDVIVGGSFQTLGVNPDVVSRNRVAKIDKDDHTDVDAWDPNVDNTVRTILVSGSDVYVGGYFNWIGSDYRYDFAKVDSSGSATSLDLDVNGEVKSIAAYGTDIIVGGYFTTNSGKIRDRLAMSDSAGNVGSWNPGADGSVNGIVVSGTTVVVGGEFNRLGYGDDQVAIGKLAVFQDAETPSNSALPLVTGAAALSGTLSCSTGSWTAGDANLISSYAYQWVRNGSAISGATSSTHTVNAADLGNNVSCSVTAANFVGSASSTSAAVTVSGSASTPVDNSPGSASPATVKPKFSTRLLSKSLRRAIRSGKLRVKITATTAGTATVKLRSPLVKPNLAARKVTFTKAGSKRVTLKLKKKCKKYLKRQLRRRKRRGLKRFTVNMRTYGFAAGTKVKSVSWGKLKISSR